MSFAPFPPYLREAQEKRLFDSSVVSRPQPGMGDPIYKVVMAETPSGAASPG